tara:strand:+ start:184 stop:486 length:303 start_codon:yes stop_codon:yes gene_type:complete
MNRYKFSKILRDKLGHRNYDQTLYPKIEESENDIYITARVGDRLDMYAYRFYRDTSLWWIIAQANQLSNGSLSVEPGKQVRIPQNLQKILGDLEFINRKR